MRDGWWHATAAAVGAITTNKGVCLLPDNANRYRDALNTSARFGKFSNEAKLVINKHVFSLHI